MTEWIVLDDEHRFTDEDWLKSFLGWLWDPESDLTTFQIEQQLGVTIP